MGLSGDEEKYYSKILGMLTTNELKADVEAEYSLDQFQRAIKHMEGEGRKGKILFSL